MANEEHVTRLEQGIFTWNTWRQEGILSPKSFGPNFSDGPFAIDLRDASLRRANLMHADLHGADLTSANLSGADLRYANLTAANLSQANLYEAQLVEAGLFGANLFGANLSGAGLKSANLIGATLMGADLSRADLTHALIGSTELYGTDLTRARLSNTTFMDVNFLGVRGLDTCHHEGPSSIDYPSLQKSGPLPLPFLRGLGLPDNFIEYLPSLLNQPIQHYSCFVSYSTKEQNFADRLHADLQNKGVRCWFAPHDMPIGGKIWDEIDAAIRLRDKVLLILSEQSIKSDWVEDEVTKAFEEERNREKAILFPIRLDDAVLDTNEPWAAKLRARHIGDFRRWKEHDAYQKSFARVLRDLTAVGRIKRSAIRRMMRSPRRNTLRYCALRTGRAANSASPRPAKRGEGAERMRGGRGAFQITRRPSPGSAFGRATLSRKRERGKQAGEGKVERVAPAQRGLTLAPARRGDKLLKIIYPRAKKLPDNACTLLTEGRHHEASWWWSRPESGAGDAALNSGSRRPAIPGLVLVRRPRCRLATGTRAASGLRSGTQ